MRLLISSLTRGAEGARNSLIIRTIMSHPAQVAHETKSHFIEACASVSQHAALLATVKPHCVKLVYVTVSGATRAGPAAAAALGR